VIYRAQRAIRSEDSVGPWVVIDENCELHPEANAYLASLRAMDRSINTEPLYTGRIGLYLTYCSHRSLNSKKILVLHERPCAA
jgi:integrase/recombinase XerD